MNTVDVTIVSSLYGTSHDRFAAAWEQGILHLEPFPYGITELACDRDIIVLGSFNAGPCDWKHPQAFYLQRALDRVETEWVWIHDIDDVAYPDALDGIELVQADVWQFGYRRSDGETYLPPQLTAAEVLTASSNPFVAGSCVRTAALRYAGGFPDLALQDWALWRNLALGGCSFQSSDRIHFHYRRHPAARGEIELTTKHRKRDVREMLEAEASVARV